MITDEDIANAAGAAMKVLLETGSNLVGIVVGVVWVHDENETRSRYDYRMYENRRRHA